MLNGKPLMGPVLLLTDQEPETDKGREYKALFCKTTGTGPTEVPEQTAGKVTVCKTGRGIIFNVIGMAERMQPLAFAIVIFPFTTPGLTPEPILKFIGKLVVVIFETPLGGLVH